jgi:hypothetical protein
MFWTLIKLLLDHGKATVHRLLSIQDYLTKNGITLHP